MSPEERIGELEAVKARLGVLIEAQAALIEELRGRVAELESRPGWDLGELVVASVA